MNEEPDLELDISGDLIHSSAYLPEHMTRLRDLIARLRASDRSAIIFVDGRLGKIQVFNAVPAGMFTIR